MNLMNFNPVYIKILNFMTILILISVVLYQFHTLAKLSSEVDDIGVYQSIVTGQQKRAEIHQTVNKSTDPELVSIINTKFGNEASQFASKLAELNMLTLVIKAATERNYYFNVSRSWSYAPGNYFITPFLIDGSETYEKAKLKIRAVSKLFWLFGLAGIVLLFVKVDTPHIAPAGLFFLSFIITAQSQTSFSAHASNYASGLFAAALVMLVLIERLKTLPLKTSHSIYLLIASLFQYQVIPIVFLILLHSWVDHFFQKQKIQTSWSIFRANILYVTIFLISIYPQFKNKLHMGINWNSGRNKEYTLVDNYQKFFASPNFDTATTLITEPLTALFDTVTAIYSPFSYTSPTTKVIGLVILCLIFCAFRHGFKHKPLRPFLYAASVFIFVHFAIYLFGVFPLSPTRHSLYLTVPATILGSIGMSLLIQKWVIRFPRATLPLFSLVVVTLALLSGLSNVQYLADRNDPFEKQVVKELLVSHSSPSIIINTDTTFQHHAMPHVKERKSLLDLNLHGGRNEFPVRLERLRPELGNLEVGEVVYLTRVSHWSLPQSLSDGSGQEIDEITEIICDHFKYECSFSISPPLFAFSENVSTEWVPNIQGFSNSLFINHLRLKISSVTN